MLVAEYGVRETRSPSSWDKGTRLNSATLQTAHHWQWLNPVKPHRMSIGGHRR